MADPIAQRYERRSVHRELLELGGIGVRVVFGCRAGVFGGRLLKSMRYILLICHDSILTSRTVKGDSAAWLEETERRGVHNHGDRPRPAAEVNLPRLSEQDFRVDKFGLCRG